MTMRTKCFGLAVWLAMLALHFDAFAQVRSVTLGIRTHCPYGIRGCWAEIRDGLERPEEIASICKEPDTRTDTCEVRMQENWVPDPDMFARNFTNMHIGVDVRGVEVVVDGSLQMHGTNLVLQVTDPDITINLTPLTCKVQWDTKRKQPATPTRAERRAFQQLARLFDGKRLGVRIVGPLKSRDDGQRVLEIRKFQVISGKSG